MSGSALREDSASRHPILGRLPIGRTEAVVRDSLVAAVPDLPAALRTLTLD